MHRSERPKSELSCSSDNGRAIKTHIRKHYENLYGGKHHCKVPILTGRKLAEALDYPLDLLGFVPESYWQGFAPCGNPLPMVRPNPGERVLNLGCGAAVDSLALWAIHGALLESIVSMDIVFNVTKKASALARDIYSEPSSLASTQRASFSWLCADGEKLPFQPGVFKWVVMNGVFNLFPDKVLLLGELSRVLSPGGHVVGTDLCSDAPLPDYFYEEGDAWAWCMSGACTDEDLRGLLAEAGFEAISLSREEDGEMFHRVAFSGRKK